MDQLRALPTSLEGAADPTFQIYTPLLQTNSMWIKSVTKRTFKYGRDGRKELDVYYPAQPRLINGRQAVLLFLYGDGFARGDKDLPLIPDGLVHRNVGAFFALNCGYTVVIPNYRLIEHGAEYPSGGQDVAMAVYWIAMNGRSEGGLGQEPIDLFILGNSAGGVHVITYLLHPVFAALRYPVLVGMNERLRGVILLSVPFNFDSAEGRRLDAVQTYLGDKYETNSPRGLVRSSRMENGTLEFLQMGAKALVLDCEYDPNDAIRRPYADL